MEDRDLDWLAIENAEAAKALTDATMQRALTPFLDRDCTVARAARELGVNPNTLLYRVNRLLALGLLRSVREERRTGKPIKVYRSSAAGFFVPFELTTAETLEAMLMPLERGWHERFVRNAAALMARHGGGLGVRVWREANQVIAKPGPPPPTAFDAALLEQLPMLSVWSSSIRLDPEEAQAFRLELLELFSRYSGRGGQERHILHLAIAPHSRD